MVITSNGRIQQLNRAFASEYYYVCDDVEGKRYNCKKDFDYVLIQIYQTMCSKPFKKFIFYDVDMK